MEEWLFIPDFDKYEISSYGRVYSHLSSKILKLRVSGGYVLVNLGRKHTEWVHRLVMLVFVGPCPADLEVCHSDGISVNNYLDNLYYGTHQQNVQDTIRHGRNAMLNRIRCPRDHLLIPPNLVRNQQLQGRRTCLACGRANAIIRKRRWNLSDSALFKDVSDQYYVELIEEE